MSAFKVRGINLRIMNVRPTKGLSLLRITPWKGNGIWSCSECFGFLRLASCCTLHFRTYQLPFLLMKRSSYFHKFWPSREASGNWICARLSSCRSKFCCIWSHHFPSSCGCVSGVRHKSQRTPWWKSWTRGTLLAVLGKTFVSALDCFLWTPERGGTL